MPIIPGLRAYSPEFVLGLSSSFGGTATASYDANGHFARISSHVGPAGPAGILSTITVPPMNGQRYNVDARCPGGAVEPADDKSNPWIPDTTLCQPGDDHP
jgi:hypothetical protein